MPDACALEQLHATAECLMYIPRAGSTDRARRAPAGKRRSGEGEGGEVVSFSSDRASSLLVRSSAKKATPNEETPAQLTPSPTGPSFVSAAFAASTAGAPVTGLPLTRLHTVLFCEILMAGMASWNLHT